VSVTSPEGLRWVFRVVAGEYWPIGDEDALRLAGGVGNVLYDYPE
jgi:hypothetical protein